MPSYIHTPKGFMNKETGEIEPFVNRVYSDDNPPPRPLIHTGDDQEALVSMADGKRYTSKAAMRESYKASGNPRGQEFIEVGDDPNYITPTMKRHESKKEEFLVAVEKAEAAINRGEFQEIQ